MHNQSYFESHKKFYFDKNSPFWQRFALVLKYLKPNTKDVILECGCGIGTMAVELTKKSKRVVAVDNLALAIKLAKNFVVEVAPRLKNLEFVEADLAKLPFNNNTFDKICFSEIIEHLKDPKTALSEIKRVLKTNGTMFVSTWPNLSNIFWRLRYRLGLGSKADFNPQSVTSLKNLLLSAGFKVELLEATDIYIPGLIPLLIIFFGRGKRLDIIIDNLKVYFTKGRLAPYFSATIIGVCKK